MPAGPCIGCGATNYPNSMGGPSICPRCDCGLPAPPKSQTGGSIADVISKMTGPYAAPSDDFYRLSLDEARGALRRLLAASAAVAVYQPAAHAKDQAEADRWADFYSAIVDGWRVPQFDNDAGGRLARQPWGIFDKAAGHWWPRSFKTPEEAQAHLDACTGPERATSVVGALVHHDVEGMATPPAG